MSTEAYRSLPSYSMDPRIAQAYDDATPSQKRLLNMIADLDPEMDTDAFGWRVREIEGKLASAGALPGGPMPNEQIETDKGYVIGFLEGCGAQMVMGREEARRVMFPEGEPSRAFPQTPDDWAQLASDIKERCPDDPVMRASVNYQLGVIYYGEGDVDAAKKWLVEKARELGIS